MQYGRMARTEMVLMKMILTRVYLGVTLVLMLVVWVTASSLCRAMAVRLNVEIYIEAPWKQ